MSASFEKFIKLYRTIAVLCLNTVLIFLLLGVMLEGGLRLFFTVYDAHFRSINPIQRKYHALRADLYPGLTSDQINDLLTESWSRPEIYEPYTTFKEQPFLGRYFHIDRNGYRWGKGPAAWPPTNDVFNVFVFGGSTTFGYGNPDEHTIPSFLELTLPVQRGKKVRVYNFGRSDYFSTQERILFEKLLMSAPAPQMAIFIDGLNDFGYVEDRPHWSHELSQFMDPHPWKALRMSFVRFAAESALSRATHSISQGMVAFVLRPKGSPPVATAWAPEDIQKVIQRYCSNKRMIEAVARASKVSTVFVWQPVPYYNCPPGGNPFARLGVQYEGGGKSYVAMKDYVDHHPLGSNFFWAADFQNRMSGPLYVDAVHYSAPMSREFARQIAEFIQRMPG